MAPSSIYHPFKLLAPISGCPVVVSRFTSRAVYRSRLFLPCESRPNDCLATLPTHSRPCTLLSSPLCLQLIPIHAALSCTPSHTILLDPTSETIVQEKCGPKKMTASPLHRTVAGVEPYQKPRLRSRTAADPGQRLFGLALILRFGAIDEPLIRAPASSMEKSSRGIKALDVWKITRSRIEVEE
jgi:hypothetical protein